MREGFLHHVSKELNSVINVGYNWNHENNGWCAAYSKAEFGIDTGQMWLFNPKLGTNYLLNVIRRAAAGQVISGKVASPIRAVVTWHCDISVRGLSSPQTAMMILFSNIPCCQSCLLWLHIIIKLVASRLLVSSNGVIHIVLKDWKVRVSCKWWPSAMFPWAVVSDPHKVNPVRPAQC